MRRHTTRLRGRHEQQQQQRHHLVNPSSSRLALGPQSCRSCYRRRRRPSCNYATTHSWLLLRPPSETSSHTQTHTYKQHQPPARARDISESFVIVRRRRRRRWPVHLRHLKRHTRLTHTHTHTKTRTHKHKHKYTRTRTIGGRAHLPILKRYLCGWSDRPRRRRHSLRELNARSHTHARTHAHEQERQPERRRRQWQQSQRTSRRV